MSKKSICYFMLASIIVLQMLGIGTITSEAAASGKYFISGKLYYHVISESQVEVCGTKQVGDTLIIPGKVTYKGKQYTVTQIADHTISYQDVPITEETSNGSSVAVSLAGYHSYRYDKKGKRELSTDIDWLSGSQMTKVILPDTLTYIGEGAFNGCTELKTVQFAKKYKKLTIGKNAFGGNKITRLDFPEGTYELKENAAGDVSSISIPATVKKIGAGVVNANTKKVTISGKNKNYKMKSGILYTKNEKTLVGVSGKAGTSIKISAKTTTIGAKAFAGTKVKNVTLNKKITDIPKGAFYDCKKLVSVTGADNVKSIGYAAFANCPKLKSIGNGAKLTTIKRAAFWGDEKLVLNISAALKDIDTYAFSGTQTGTTMKITVAQENPVYSIKDNLLIKTSGNDKVVMMQMEDMEKIIVPEDVTDVAVVLGGGKCTSITFPAALRSQEGAVSAAGGTVIYLGETVPKFGPDYDIKVSHKKVTTVMVPQKALQDYKKSIADVISKRDGDDIWDSEDVVLKAYE